MVLGHVYTCAMWHARARDCPRSTTTGTHGRQFPTEHPIQRPTEGKCIEVRNSGVSNIQLLAQVAAACRQGLRASNDRLRTTG